MSELKLHNYQGSQENMEQLKMCLAEKGWKLTLCNHFKLGSEYGTWYEAFDFSNLSDKEAVKNILFYYQHSSYRDFSYLFICRSPQKIKAGIEKEIHHADFDYTLIESYGDGLIQWVKKLS